MAATGAANASSVGRKPSTGLVVQRNGGVQTPLGRGRSRRHWLRSGTLGSAQRNGSGGSAAVLGGCTLALEIATEEIRAPALGRRGVAARLSN